MAMNVPFPLRVAAGAIAVGLDRLRTLPTELPALSVSLAGHAVRASMRVQQELAHLAARGEEVLSPLTDRPEEHPAWAHFDDEDDDNADGTGDVVDGAVIDDPADDAAKDAAAEPAPAMASTTADPPADATAALPGYDEMSVAQLRPRLKALNEAAVAALLDHEHSGRARAAFVTTLRNRLTSLRSTEGGAPDSDAHAGSGKRV
jgi:hypothetical protein